MKSRDVRLIDGAKAGCPSTWGWSTDGENTMMFVFDEGSASAVWDGASISLNWSKELEKTLN